MANNKQNRLGELGCVAEPKEHVWVNCASKTLIDSDRIMMVASRACRIALSPSSSHGQLLKQF